MMQWKVFSEHAALDQKEEVERLRDLAEYAMAFHNYEAVNSVQKARELATYPEDQTEDPVEDIFLKQVEQLFGKKLDKGAMGASKAAVEKEELRKESQEPIYKNTRQRIREDVIRVSKREEEKKDK